MDKLKCSACGSTGLLPMKGEDFFEMGMDTYFTTKFDCFICPKCGHIDFYAQDRVMVKLGLREKKQGPSTVVNTATGKVIHIKKYTK